MHGFPIAGVADKGVLMCQLTPKQAQGQQLDAVVVSGTSRVGLPLEVAECEESGEYTLITQVREWTAGSGCAPPAIPIQALSAHGQPSGVAHATAVDPTTGKMTGAINTLSDAIVHDLGGLITATKVKVGDYVQAESLSPTLAGANVESGLKALALAGQELKRQRAAAAAAAAAAATAADGPAAAAGSLDASADGYYSVEGDWIPLARSSSRARIAGACGYTRPCMRAHQSCR